MFDNVLLDVFIGMALLYLLYSLLVSLLGEVISNWLGIRARLLRQGMETMLNDPRQFGKFLLQFKDAALSFLLFEFKSFRHSLAGRFYRQPSIRFLSPGRKNKWMVFKQSKPSYISKENFADTVIQMLISKGSGSTIAEKISFSLKFNTLDIDPKTLKHFRDILIESGANTEQFKKRLFGWYDETTDRITGWYKSKMQLILFLLGLTLAVVFNVDSIKIAKLLATNKDAREKMVELGIKAADSSSSIARALERTGDTTTSDSLLRESLNEVRRSVDESNKVLGLGWEFETRLRPNQVTFDVFPYTLSRLEADLLIPIRNSVKNSENLRKQIKVTKNGQILRMLQDQLQKEQTQIVFLTERFNRITSANMAAGHLISYKSKSYPQGTLCVEFLGQRQFTATDKVIFLFRQVNPFTAAFWGFVITALMLSLGSNFWFDLLRKLVAVRGGGVKPEEKKTEAGASTLPETGAVGVTRDVSVTMAEPAMPGEIIEAAIREFAPEIKRIPGVRAIMKGIDMAGGTATQVLQVNVLDAKVKEVVEAKFSGRSIEDIPVGLLVQTTGNASTHQDPNGQIGNIADRNHFGSLGCILQNRESKQSHLLSCWHVMKAGELDQGSPPDTPHIIDAQGRTIGVRWGGGILGPMDYALAKSDDQTILKYNEFLKTNLQFNTLRTGSLSINDIVNQKKIIYYDVKGNKAVSGKIYSECVSAAIMYPDRIREVNDLLVLTNNEGTRSISTGGNSGSVIFTQNPADTKTGMAVGMIIGGDDQYTYAMKLSHLFRLYDELDFFA